MNLFRKLFRLPPPAPFRVVKCYFCHEDVKTLIMDGDVGHLMCILAEEAIQKTKREKEAADRHQIELYKIAMREMASENP